MDIDVVAHAIEADGTTVIVRNSPAELLQPLHSFVESGDIVLMMSNGAMGGLHGKLLNRLA